MMVYTPGDIYYQGCQRCECLNNGTINCINEACCLYAKDGVTKRAYPEEEYHDGCNKCTCFEDGGVGVASCTEKKCQSKCNFENWDLVTEYAEIGDTEVMAYDRRVGKWGCPKICSCKKTKRGAKIACDKGYSTCIVN